jgi:hypothetical protein
MDLVVGLREYSPHARLAKSVSIFPVRLSPDLNSAGNRLRLAATRASPSRKLRTLVEYELSCGRIHAGSFPQAGSDCYGEHAGAFLVREWPQPTQTQLKPRTAIRRQPIVKLPRFMAE